MVWQTDTFFTRFPIEISFSRRSIKKWWETVANTLRDSTLRTMLIRIHFFFYFYYYFIFYIFYLLSSSLNGNIPDAPVISSTTSCAYLRQLFLCPQTHSIRAHIPCRDVHWNAHRRIYVAGRKWTISCTQVVVIVRLFSVRFDGANRIGQCIT